MNEQIIVYDLIDVFLLGGMITLGTTLAVIAWKVLRGEL